MHIHDFHSKLVSANEEGHLFEALRSLSQMDDPKVVFDGETTNSEWATWPPMDAHSSHAASTGV